jgi:hypothetical protein
MTAAGTGASGAAIPGPTTETFGTVVVTQGAGAPQDVDTGEDDFGEAEARPRRVQIPQDGDPVSVFEPAAPADGVIDLAEPNVMARRGPDAGRPALAGDIAAFAGGDPGFDLLLQARNQSVFSDRVVRRFAPDPFRSASGSAASSSSPRWDRQRLATAFSRRPWRLATSLR